MELRSETERRERITAEFRRQIKAEDYLTKIHPSTDEWATLGKICHNPDQLPEHVHARLAELIPALEYASSYHEVGMFLRAFARLGGMMS